MPCCGARALLRSRGDVQYKLRHIKKRPLRSGLWGADTRGCVVYFFRSSAASLAASLTFCATCFASPFALSTFPSACVLLSPVRPPTASLTAPLVLSHSPAISLSWFGTCGD